MKILKSGLIGLALAITVSAAFAQPVQTRRIAGTVEKADGDTLVVKPQAGDAVTIHLADKVSIYGVRKGAMADLTPNAFIGVGAMPQADGSQRAMQITVFSESQRGVGEGFRPWDRAPNSTMTNGTVDTRVGAIIGAKPRADGSLDASRVNVGRGDIVPR
jgi:hypothetical protein